MKTKSHANVVNIEKFTVSGDAMAPEYPSGTTVIIAPIDMYAFIAWGEVYVLDTLNGMMIKRVIPSDKEGYIRCISVNSAYLPFDVCKKDIYGIYRVTMSFSMK